MDGVRSALQSDLDSLLYVLVCEVLSDVKFRQMQSVHCNSDARPHSNDVFHQQHSARGRG